MERRGRLAGLLFGIAVVVAVVLSGLGTRPAGGTGDSLAAEPLAAGVLAPDRLGPPRHATLAPPAADTAESPPDPASLSGYVWPLKGARLTQPFGPSPFGSLVVDGRPFHDGIDLATFCGDHVVAAHDGIVLAAGRRYDEYVGWVGDLGPYVARLDAKKLWSTLPMVVVIDDGDGYRSIYAHFSSVSVAVGQHVRANQLLGVEGMTGHATGCHVHYGLFSPLETATFAEDPATVKRILVPPLEIARIDPLRVLTRGPGLAPPSTLRPASARAS